MVRMSGRREIHSWGAEWEKSFARHRTEAVRRREEEEQRMLQEEVM